MLTCFVLVFTSVEVLIYKLIQTNKINLQLLANVLAYVFKKISISTKILALLLCGNLRIWICIIMRRSVVRLGK